MLAAPTPTLFAYRSSLALLTDRCCLLLRLAVAGHFIYSLTLFVSSAFIGGLIDLAHDFECGTAFVESVILLFSPSGVDAFVSDIGLLYVLLDSLFNNG